MRPLVGRRGRELGGGKAEAAVGGVKDGVEALQERLAVDEVEALARVAAEVADDEVYIPRAAADERVEGALQRAVSVRLRRTAQGDWATHRPDLRVGRERVDRAADLEVQVLEAVELRGREAQQTRGLVLRRACCFLVLLQRICVALASASSEEQLEGKSY